MSPLSQAVSSLRFAPSTILTASTPQVYAYYHFSGGKKVIDASKNVHQYVQRTKASITERAPKNPAEALAFLRGIAKSYAGVVPGASAYVDSSFDVLDELHDTHRAELDHILQAAYDDITAILTEASSKGLDGADAATAGRLVTVLAKHMGALNALAGRAGGDAFSRFEQRFPQAAQTLGTSYGELRALAERSGPEAKKIVEDSIKQVQDVFVNKGAPDAINHAKEVLKDQGKRLREMMWDHAAEAVKEDPQLRDLLNENKEAFVQSGATAGTLKEVFERVKQVAKEGGGKESISKMREYLQGKVKEAKEATEDGKKSS